MPLIYVKIGRKLVLEEQDNKNSTVYNNRLYLCTRMITKITKNCVKEE